MAAASIRLVWMLPLREVFRRTRNACDTCRDRLYFVVETKGSLFTDNVVTVVKG